MCVTTFSIQQKLKPICQFAWLLVMVLTAGHSRAAELKIGLIAPERPPYYFQSRQGKATGLYIDIIEYVLVDSGYQAKYLFYPQARLRKQMALGLIDIEPGINESWRARPQEVSNSVYTDAFMMSDEVYVFPAKQAFDVEDPQLQEVKFQCSVNGFNVISGTNLASMLQPTTEFQVLDMLAMARCDYALMPIDVVRHYVKKNGKVLDISQPQMSFALKLRLNSRWQPLLPHLNRKIEQLITTGTLQQLINKYEY